MTLASQPAFPAQDSGGNLYSGLTKREYFAGLSMLSPHIVSVGSPLDYHNPPALAARAVGIADALLAELEKEKS